MQETCNHVVSCDFQSHETVCFFCLFYTEEPFYLKEVYLPTGCSDCVLAHEEVISGNDTFTSLLLFSKKHTSHYTMCESRTLFFFLLLFFEAWKSVEKPLATPPPPFFSLLFISRQENECLSWRCGDVKERSRMSPDVITHYDGPKQRWEFQHISQQTVSLLCHKSCLFVFLFVFFAYTEICPDNLPPSEGLSILNSLLENKMAHRVARVLDVVFDVFVNW